MLTCLDRGEAIYIDKISNIELRSYLSDIIKDISEINISSLKSMSTLSSSSSTSNTLCFKIKSYLLHRDITKKVNRLSNSEATSFRCGIPRLIHLISELPTLRSELPDFINNLIEQEGVDLSGMNDENTKEKLSQFLLSLGMSYDNDSDSDDVFVFPDDDTKQEILKECLQHICHVFHMAQQYRSLDLNSTTSNTIGSSGHDKKRKHHKNDEEDRNSDNKAKRKKEKKHKKDKKHKHKHRKHTDSESDSESTTSSSSPSHKNKHDYRHSNEINNNNMTTIGTSSTSKVIGPIGPTRPPSSSSSSSSSSSYNNNHNLNDDDYDDIGPTPGANNCSSSHNHQSSSAYTALSTNPTLTTDISSTSHDKYVPLGGVLEKSGQSSQQCEDEGGGGQGQASEITTREEWMMDIGENKILSGRNIISMYKYINIWYTHNTAHTNNNNCSSLLLLLLGAFGASTRKFQNGKLAKKAADMYLMAKHAQTPATMTETERETEELRGPSLMDLHLQKKGEVEKQQQQQNMLDSKNGHSVRRAFDREKVCHVCVMSCVCHVM